MSQEDQDRVSQKSFCEKELPNPMPMDIPGIEPIVVQAVESLFPDVNTQKRAYEYILQIKKERQGIADLKTLLALLKYSKGDVELFRKSAWQSHPHFWMDEISHIFRTLEDAEEWAKSISKS
jgi:hypothetical protein